MIAYHLDSNAVIARYVTEAGSDLLKAVVFADDGALPLASRVPMVEVRSALARCRREASISPEYHADALAGSLLEHHVLRAFDTVPFASALVAAQLLTEANLPQPIFLSAEDRLLQAASAEGLQIENPNHFQ